MPRVKNSAFSCPECGNSTRVLRTRKATASRVVRYRGCDCGNRFATKEILISEPVTAEKAIGTTRVQIALRNLIEDLGIDQDSTTIPSPRL